MAISAELIDPTELKDGEIRAIHPPSPLQPSSFLRRRPHPDPRCELSPPVSYYIASTVLLVPDTGVLYGMRAPSPCAHHTPQYYTRATIVAL